MRTSRLPGSANLTALPAVAAQGFANVMDKLSDGQGGSAKA
ncbi:MAG TPA: hypothetical protein VE934_15300 [Polaromonas sp.]|nr:hypothetical protein [Polaromonas sp.]HYW58321.1 hypothetical protein [Polaromonas sp.]